MKTIFSWTKNEKGELYKKPSEENGRVLEKEIITDQGWEKLIESVYRPKVCFLKKLDFSYENKSATAKLFVNYSNTNFPLEYVQAIHLQHGLNLILVAFMYEFIHKYIENMDNKAEFDVNMFKQIVKDSKFRDAKNDIKYNQEVEMKKEFEAKFELTSLRVMHNLFILEADVEGPFNGKNMWVFPLNQKINEKKDMDDEEKAREIERIKTNEAFLRKLAKDQYTNKKSKYSKK